MRPPKTVRTGDQQADDLSQDVQRLSSSLSSSPFGSGTLITGLPSANGSGVLTDGVTCTAGVPMEVAHGLGRRARGFFEIAHAHRNGGDPCGLVPEPSTADLARVIRFRPSNSGTCWIWVF